MLRIFQHLRPYALDQFIGALRSVAERAKAGDASLKTAPHFAPRSRLDETLAARKPKLVLVEGPADATELVRHIVDPKTKPPVALYSSYRDDANTR